MKYRDVFKDAVTTRRDTGTSVELPGRVIRALYLDPELMRKTGGTHIAVELARQYGIQDIDGSLPRSLRDERGAPIWEPV